MPRKWRQPYYEDGDDDGYDDYHYDEEEVEDCSGEQAVSTSSASGGKGEIDTPDQQHSSTTIREPVMEEETWPCSVCTFDNPLDTETCDICDTPREEACKIPSTSTDSANNEIKLERGSALAASNETKIVRGSALARALFKPLPGTKSNKVSPSTLFKHDVMVIPEKLGSNLPNPLPLTSKIVPFKFNTLSPDEKNLAARGLKKNHAKTSSASEDILSTTRISIARTEASKPAIPTPVSKSNRMPSAPHIEPTIAKREASTNQYKSRILNGSSDQASSSQEGELVDTMKHMSVGGDHREARGTEVTESLTTRRGLPLDSYMPEPWMLKDVKKDPRQLLHLIVVGHVDAGKSTLMGRILHLLGRVTQKEMHKNEKESKQQGKGSFAYAFVLDEGAEERARGVTMTIAVAHFETPRLHVVLLDAPGHKDFVPNMISGASQADAAILVVDASLGAFEAGLEGEGQGGGQTREHAQLVRSLGVEQLIVAVNKLDAVDYSKDRFDFIKSTLQPFLKQCGFKDGAVQWVPVSAGEGENLKDAPTNAKLKSWYKGHSVVELVDSLEPPVRLGAKPLRLVIAEVMKTRTLGASALGGKLESGALQIGTKVRVLPSGKIATVKSIEQEGQPLTIARAGEGVDVGLTGVDPGMLAPGGVLCHPDYPVPVASRFEIRLLTLGIRVPILNGSQVILHVHHARQPARVAQLISLLDPKKGTVLRQRPRHLTANQSAIVELVPDEGVCIEEYADFRALGRVALREGGKTIAVGIVTRIIARK